MERFTGGCLCGKVRYHGSAQPVFTAVCHCKHCQKQSGSAFSMLIGVPKGSLTLSGEPLAEFQDVGDSTQPVLRSMSGLAQGEAATAPAWGSVRPCRKVSIMCALSPCCVASGYIR